MAIVAYRSVSVVSLNRHHRPNFPRWCGVPANDGVPGSRRPGVIIGVLNKTAHKQNSMHVGLRQLLLLLLLFEHEVQNRDEQNKHK